MAKLLGIRKRVGFNYKNRARFLTEKIDIEGYNEKHVAEYYLSLLKLFNITPRSKHLEVFVSAANRSKIRNILSRQGISPGELVVGLGCGAGASWGTQASYKHWPTIRFAQLADRIIEELKAKVIILGDELERPIVEAIIGMMKHKPIDMVGKTTLEELLAVMENLKILVTNDGGPLHMAVALGVATVSLFGPVDENIYGPFPAGREHIVVKPEIPCRPCYRNFKLPVCKVDRECMKSISADEVFAAVKEVWKA